jgi:hypothetical protein
MCQGNIYLKKKLIFALAPEQCYIALFEGKTKLKKIKN